MANKMWIFQLQWREVEDILNNSAMCTASRALSAQRRRGEGRLQTLAKKCQVQRRKGKQVSKNVCVCVNGKVRWRGSSISSGQLAQNWLKKVAHICTIDYSNKMKLLAELCRKVGSAQKSNRPLFSIQSLCVCVNDIYLTTLYCFCLLYKKEWKPIFLIEDSTQQWQCIALRKVH